MVAEKGCGIITNMASERCGWFVFVNLVCAALETSSCMVASCKMLAGFKFGAKDGGANNTAIRNLQIV